MGPNDPILDIEVARQKFREAEDLFERRRDYAPLGWEIRQPRFPQLEVFYLAGGRKKIGLRLGLRNYDFLAASVQFLSPSGALMTEPIPVAMFPQSSGPPMSRIVGAHPLTRLPFLCVEGTWEFHSHIQHQHKRWDDYRGTINLTDVIAGAFDALDQNWLRA